MTRAQIDILIKHGDISSEAYPGENYYHSDECAFQASNGIRYWISKEMYNIFYSLFEHNEPFFGFDKFEFDKTVNVNIAIRPKNKEGKLKALTDLLEIEIDNLQKLTGNLTYYNTPDTLKELWFFDFFVDGEKIIECLKFEILAGKKLNEFKLPYQKELPNRHQLDSYFNTPEMAKIYDVIEMNDKINYLKKIISEIDKPKSNEPTHRINAIVRMFLEEAYPTIFTKLLRTEISIKNFEIQLNNLGYWGKTESKTAKAIEIKDLEKINELNLLKIYPHAQTKLNDKMKELNKS